MNSFLQAVFGASWKTTVAGYGTAAIIAAGDYLQNNGKVDAGALATAVGIAVLGRFAKDHNVSNAPSPNPTGKTV